MDEMSHIHQRLTLASVSTACLGWSIIDYHMAGEKYFKQSRRGIKVICQLCDTKPRQCQLSSTYLALNWSKWPPIHHYSNSGADVIYKYFFEML